MTSKYNAIMKEIFIWILLFIAPLLGCGSAEEKKTIPAPASTEDPHKVNSSRAPNYEGLIREYRAILAEDPNNLAVIIALGNAYYDSGQWKKAIMPYEHALSIDPGNADVLTDMGTAYRNAGRPDRALAEYRAAVEHEPLHVDARYNMGIVYAVNKRDYPAAIRVWQEVLRIAPNYPHAGTIRASIAAFENELKKGTK